MLFYYSCKKLNPEPKVWVFCFRELKTTKIQLFGSRMDDTIRGGDIDLLVNPKTKLTAQELVRNKIRFLSQLDIQLGEQKIDLIVLTDENRTMGIVRTALQTGIEL